MHLGILLKLLVKFCSPYRVFSAVHFFPSLPWPGALLLVGTGRPGIIVKETFKQYLLKQYKFSFINFVRPGAPSVPGPRLSDPAIIVAGGTSVMAKNNRSI